jgi:hypothetical protein
VKPWIEFSKSKFALQKQRPLVDTPSASVIDTIE